MTAKSTVKLHGLARLLAEIVNNYGLNCHLNDISRMRSVELSTKELRKVIIDPHGNESPKLIDFCESTSHMSK